MEFHRIDARSVGIISQFKLGFGIIFHIQICICGYGFAYVAEAGTLTPYRIGKTSFVPDYGGSAHEQLIDAVGKLCAGQLIIFADMLTEQSDCTRHVGRSHGSTAVDGVAADDG